MTTGNVTNEVEQLPPARRTPLTDDYPTGPAVGERLPDFTLPDQNGQPITLSEATRGRRSVVFFHRSAAWCPYCRTHLTSFQKHIEAFRSVGIEVFAISSDPVEVLASFAAEQGIKYPLLSDAGSEVIRQFGILNTLISPEEDRFGIAYPGVYVTDEQGTVVEKMFHREYAVRESVAGILHNILGSEFRIDDSPRADVDGPGVRVSAMLGEDHLTFMQQTTLIVRMDLDPGLHVYSAPVPDGFVATEITVSPVEGLRIGSVQAPPTHTFRVEGVATPFEVFEGDLEFTIPLVSELREQPSVTLDLTVRYQACDDRQCFLPQTKTLSIEVPLAGLNRPPHPPAS